MCLGNPGVCFKGSGMNEAWSAIKQIQNENCSKVEERRRETRDQMDQIIYWKWTNGPVKVFYNIALVLDV